MLKSEKGKKSGSIDSRIKALQNEIRPRAPKSSPSSQAHIAWRMTIDLVAGVGLGFLIGFGLDKLLATTPFLMLALTLLGLAAGVNLMLRTAKELTSSGTEQPDNGSEN